ncbi:MAG: MerR family transcriptional regulator [Deltaproteobacteria bacterium]|jgi:DNA-binding transcriptional MerR regulator/methylmalonyl-CoA mutase cobalamin-binding subunit|nr:MerR family transcriptional regulator [Deltaproteobacteria bacterium]
MNQARRLEAPFSVGVVSRMTGLSVHVLRSWERRYGAVQPQRTPRGSRRYTEADVTRLRLLGAAVGRGHPISALAPLSDTSISALLEPHGHAPELPFDEALGAIARLDAREVERLLAFQLFARGPRDFARNFVLPLLIEVGARWESGRLPIAAEHMATFLAGSLLGGALRAMPVPERRRPILFTTPTGERHEFGALVAALVAASAGADAVYLGAELPASEVVRAAAQLNARGIALGMIALDPADTKAYLHALRRDLDRSASIWIGGGASQRLEPLPDGVARADDLDAFEDCIRDLATRDVADSAAHR